MSKPVFEDLFAFSGRRNRKSYFLLSLLLMVFNIIISAIMWSINAQAIYLAETLGNQAAGNGGVFWGIALVVVLLLMALVNAIAGAQRCRDFGWTGWAILIPLIPIIGWIFAIAMYFIPGTLGPNRYGPDPLGGFTS